MMQVSMCRGTFCLALLTVISVADACKARLVNQAFGFSNVTLFALNGGKIAFASRYEVSAYSEFPCNTTQLYAVADNGQQTAVSLPAYTSSSQLTFVAAWVNFEPYLAAQVFLDEDAPLSVNSSTISGSTLRFCNFLESWVDVYAVVAECHNCMIPHVSRIEFASCGPSYLSQTTDFDLKVRITNDRLDTTGTISMQELGAYTLFINSQPDNVTNNDFSAATIFVTDVAGRNMYWPILYTALILLGMSLFFRLLQLVVVRNAQWLESTTDVIEQVTSRPRGGAVPITLYSFFGWDLAISKYAARVKNAKLSLQEGGSDTTQQLLVEPIEVSATLNEASSGSNPNSVAPIQKPAISKVNSRIRAIDAFRGTCLSIMIFVNYGGGLYAFFDHSKWNGLTVADLVFPWFVWTSGVSMAISYQSERGKGATRRQLATKALIRSLKLYALALFLSNGSNTSKWRVIGVLQYFSVSYLVIGVLEALLGPSRAREELLSKLSLRFILWTDLGRQWAQWLVMSLLAMIYFVVQAKLPLPDGCPTGYIGPGGLADGGKYLGLGCTGGAHRVIDVAIFGVNHIYHSIAPDGSAISAATCNEVYQCDVYDPEGALGWISAAWMVWLGLQAGKVITTYKSLADSPHGQKALLRPFLTRWIIWGIVLSLIGGCLCGFSKEDGIIPLNKNLWSPSFVTVLAGWANFILAFYYLLIDHFKVWSGAPFRYVGMNSLVIYCCHGIFQGYFPMTWAAGATWSSHTEAIASNVTGVIVWHCVARMLYLRKIFVNF